MPSMKKLVSSVFLPAVQRSEAYNKKKKIKEELLQELDERREEALKKFRDSRSSPPTDTKVLAVLYSHRDDETPLARGKKRLLTNTPT